MIDERAMIWNALDWAKEINGTQGVLEISFAMGIEEHRYCRGCEEHYPHLEDECVMCGGQNNHRPCEHVLKAWLEKPIDERQALLESCKGMDVLFGDLGGDDCTTDYFAFLFLVHWVGGDPKPRHINQAYKYAELWSKWDLENQDLTATMSSYDSFDYYMDNEFYTTQNINS